MIIKLDHSGFCLWRIAAGRMACKLEAALLALEPLLSSGFSVFDYFGGTAFGAGRSFVHACPMCKKRSRSLRIGHHQLENIRNSWLPRLLSGALDISEIDI